MDQVRTCFSAARRWIRVHRCYRFAPSSKKGMLRPHRDTELADFCALQPVATVCEPPATISTVSPHRKQSATDCNIARSEEGPETAKKPVVEHKGWDALFGFSVAFWFQWLWFGRDAFRSLCIPFGMRLRFCDFRRPKPFPLPPYKLRGISEWPSEQSDFLRLLTKEFKRQLGSAVSHHQRHSSAIRWNRNCRDAAKNSSAQKNDSRPAPNKSGGKSSVSGEHSRHCSRSWTAWLRFC